MKIFVKNKDIRRVVEELREYIDFLSVSVRFDYARLIISNNYEVEVYRFSEASRGYRSDFIVYDDDITDKEANEIIYPMVVRTRDEDDVEPIVITYKQFLKLSRIFV